MFLSSRALSKRNDALTADTIKWMFKNALNMDQNELYQIKAGENADHPLMKEESLYDDLPVEVLGLFVMEPYFPRKHFNRAFAWLFGKESIAQIEAGDFDHYERLVRENTCYTLRNFWKELPLTCEEHSHIFNALTTSSENDVHGQRAACRIGLLKHASISPEIYQQELSANAIRPELNVCAEIADQYIDRCIASFKERKPLTEIDLVNLEVPLRLENISRDRRDALLAEFDMKSIGLSGVGIIYNKKIPDDVFNLVIENKLVSKREVKKIPSILADIRLPKEDATKIAYLNPEMFAMSFLSRTDLDSNVRADFITTIINKDKEEREYYGKASNDVQEAFALLNYDGALTLSELDLARELDYKIAIPYYKSKYYSDIPFFINSVRVMYATDVVKSGEATSDLMRDLLDVELSNILYSPHWTKELLHELLEVASTDPVNLNHLYSQTVFRKSIYRKLFCESVYPSLEKEDLTGRYGRAENILAKLLNRDASLLSEFDIDLLARARIQLDYRDAEVNLLTSLAQHPELNERLVAEHLKLRLEQNDDTPTLASSRQRRAI